MISLAKSRERKQLEIFFQVFLDPVVIWHLILLIKGLFTGWYEFLVNYSRSSISKH